MITENYEMGVIEVNQFGIGFKKHKTWDVKFGRITKYKRVKGEREIKVSETMGWWMKELELIRKLHLIKVNYNKRVMGEQLLSIQ
jgi:hypothetical protein